MTTERQAHRRHAGSLEGRASDRPAGSDAQVTARGVHLRTGSDARLSACGWGGVHLRERERESLSFTGTFLTCTPPPVTCASEGQMRATGRPRRGSDAHMRAWPTHTVHLTRDTAPWSPRT